jgi:hypothetical protein
VDELVDRLSEGAESRPYLAALGATHLDKDHIQGFGGLPERVTIGDLWFTPQVLWEQDHDELCEDAKAFVKEAERRINKLKAVGEVGSGDRTGARRGPGRVVARVADRIVVRVVR